MSARQDAQGRQRRADLRLNDLRPKQTPRRIAPARRFISVVGALFSV
jgi:hypothetical protein